MKKIAVGILGATGMVGQKFVELLYNHPWFEITALAASERSLGYKYEEIVCWHSQVPLPRSIAKMTMLPCLPDLPARLVFSGLDADVAGPIEEEFARAGYIVISNSKNHRMAPHVPLIIPEVNADHLQLIKAQPYGQGALITSPNCSVIGLTLALKPLLDKWGGEAVQVTTLQALSGAGYPGVPSLDILDNVIPYIAGEEAKIETEPLKILGAVGKGCILPSALPISAHCTRVAVSDGHMACVSLKLAKTADRCAIVEAWTHFTALPQQLKLPSAPPHPLIYLENAFHPQPKLHRQLGRGMAVSIGRLRPCPLFDWKFVVLSHNTMRGAAGGAVLNAELLVKEGYLSDCATIA